MYLNDLLKSRREEILRIAAKHGARNVRVFGSVARGEADSKSDIDLLVEFKRGTTLLGHAALMQELEDLLGVKIEKYAAKGERAFYKEELIQVLAINNSNSTINQNSLNNASLTANANTVQANMENASENNDSEINQSWEFDLDAHGQVNITQHSLLDADSNSLSNS